MSLHSFSFLLQIVSLGALAIFVFVFIAEFICGLFFDRLLMSPSEIQRLEDFSRCVKFFLAAIGMLGPGFLMLDLDWSPFENPLPLSASTMFAILFFFMAASFLVFGMKKTVEYVREYR